MAVIRKPEWRNAIETMDVDAFLAIGSPEEALQEMYVEKRAMEYWSTAGNFSGVVSGWIGCLRASERTVELRQRLRTMGCRYDRLSKTWYAPDDRTAAKAQKLVRP